MSVNLIIRNLNVSNCDKSTSKELKVEPNASIDQIIGLINREHNLNKNIELTYRGEVLKRTNTLADYLSSSNVKQVSCFMVETKKSHPTKDRPKDMDQVALSNHIVPIFRSKSKKLAIENILQNKEKLEELLKSIPKMDFISYAFVQNSDLLKLLADSKKASKIIQYRPNIYAGVKQVFNEFRETYKKVPSGTALTRASFSIEDSGDEENAPAANNNAASGLTQNHLANALNAANQRQQQQRNQITPGISRDYFQQMLQQAFSQNQQGAAASAPTTSGGTATATTSAASSAGGGEPMDTTQAPQASQQPRGARLTDSELAAKLEQMHELGLWDDELNVRALQVTEGDVEASVSLIMEGVDF